MDGIRAWSAAVCLAALGCAAIQLLVRDSGVGRVFRLVATTFFLCCMLLPLMKLGSLTQLDVADLPDAVVSELLADTVTKQLERQVQDTVSTLTAEVLAERGVTAEKIEVTTDISEEGGIYIQHVTITVDKQTVPIAKVAGEVLAKQLQASVEVTAE